MTHPVQSQKQAAQAQELSLEQLGHVVGGASTGGMLVAMGDGSVRIGDASPDGKVDAADYVVWRKSNG